MGIDKASITNTFTSGTTIRSAEVNTNYTDLETPFNSAVDIISSPPDGFAWDYQISTGIASSDLTVSLLKKDGTAFTTSNKGYIRIANTLFDIDSALSVTLDNADGDYFGWDGGKIQDNDCQLFVYLANNSGTLRIGVSPNPSKVTCGANRFYSSAQQGSAGYTNGVWSGTVAASDPCRVIGRIRVKQTDADAWTSPTTEETINYPIYKTDVLVWTPQITCSGTAPTYANNDSRFSINGNQATIVLYLSNTTGGTAGAGTGVLYSSTPFPIQGSTGLTVGTLDKFNAGAAEDFEMHSVRRSTSLKVYFSDYVGDKLDGVDQNNANRYLVGTINAIL